MSNLKMMSRSTRQRIWRNISTKSSTNKRSSRTRTSAMVWTCCKAKITTWHARSGSHCWTLRGGLQITACPLCHTATKISQDLFLLDKLGLIHCHDVSVSELHATIWNSSCTKAHLHLHHLGCKIVKNGRPSLHYGAPDCMHSHRLNLHLIPSLSSPGTYR